MKVLNDLSKAVHKKNIANQTLIKEIKHLESDLIGARVARKKSRIEVRRAQGEDCRVEDQMFDTIRTRDSGELQFQSNNWLRNAPSVHYGTSMNPNGGYQKQSIVLEKIQNPEVNHHEY